MASLQPFDADFGQIYFEHSDHKGGNLRTRAAESLAARTNDPLVRLVVLTGDAGHGKTHLCGQLLATLRGVDLAEVVDDIGSKSDGRHDLFRLSDGRSLRIVKDLSEIDVQTGARILMSALQDLEAITIVCANEGRLRSAIATGGDALLSLQQTLNRGIEFGSTASADGMLVIIDLNHQSTVTQEGHSLLRQLVASWVLDDERWEICSSCDAFARCPIYENRRLLGSSSDRGESRRRGLEELMRVVERTGIVITTRELLIVIAHIITGGSNCSEVARKVVETEADDWQWDYIFHQTIFGDRVPDNFLDRLGTFRGLRRLDPGLRAIRPVDDSLDNDTSPEVGRFMPFTVDREGPRSESRLQDSLAQAEYRRLWRLLRRRSFFEANAEPHLPPMRERLGLAHVSEFESLLEQSGDKAIRNQLLRGFEAVQGIHRKGLSNLLLVDPAFTSQDQVGAGLTRVIAVEIPLQGIALQPESVAWSEVLDGTAPEIRDAVDWIERKVVVSLRLVDKAHAVRVSLNLREFEFVMSAAEGLSSQEFFAAEERRILNQLAGLSSGRQPGSKIAVFSHRGRETLLIDGDQVHLDHG